MSDKFYISAILFLSLIAGAFWRLNVRANEKIDELNTKLAFKEANNAVVKADLATCNAKIELSNVNLKALSVPKRDEAEVKARVATKIERVPVPVKDDKCEKKLKFYEELLNEASK